MQTIDDLLPRRSCPVVICLSPSAVSAQTCSHFHSPLQAKTIKTMATIWLCMQLVNSTNQLLIVSNQTSLIECCWCRRRRRVQQCDSCSTPSKLGPAHLRSQTIQFTVKSAVGHSGHVTDCVRSGVKYTFREHPSKTDSSRSIFTGKNATLCSCACTVSHTAEFHFHCFFFKVSCKWSHSSSVPSRSVPALPIGHIRFINQRLTPFNLSHNHFCSVLGLSGSNHRSDQTDSRFFISVRDASSRGGGSLRCVQGYSSALTTRYWAQEKHIALHESRYGGVSPPHLSLPVARLRLSAVFFFCWVQRRSANTLNCFETRLTSGDAWHASEPSGDDPQHADVRHGIQSESTSHLVSLAALLKCTELGVRLLYHRVPWPAAPTRDPGCIETLHFHSDDPEHAISGLACRLFCTDHKESQFRRPCKWGAGCSAALKGLIVSGWLSFTA